MDEYKITDEELRTLYSSTNYKRLEHALTKIGVQAHSIDPIVLRSMLKGLFDDEGNTFSRPSDIYEGH